MIVLFKDTSLASIIGYVDLTKAAQIVNNREIRPFELYLFIAVVYWLCTYSMSRGRPPLRAPRRLTSASPQEGSDASTPDRSPSAAALMLHAAAALAHGPNQPPHQQYRIGDLKLESGEVIKDFAISYVTHGTLNAQKSNAILMVTAISGNHHRLDFLIGPGKALDTTKYFIVATDAIGNGLTTSPSQQPGPAPHVVPALRHPRHGASQHKLMTEQLKIPHVVAVSGPRWAGCRRCSGA